MAYKKTFASIILIALVSCIPTLRKTNAYVLDYQDFGPPVIANELIGMDWWQWQNHGDSRPRHYKIKVVVYRDIDLQKIKTDYPILPSKEQDYRYVSYENALIFLDNHISENIMVKLTEQLLRTKTMIVHSFDDK